MEIAPPKEFKRVHADNSCYSKIPWRSSSFTQYAQKFYSNEIELAEGTQSIGTTQKGGREAIECNG